MTIRRASLEDASGLAAFAARTFEETFGEANTPDDMAAYLGSAYGEPQQRAELLDANIATLIAMRADVIAGFAQVRRASPAPACVAGREPVEIWRFYVDRSWHGTGLAKELMLAAMDAARAFGGDVVWLSVWERNPRAIAFYRKCGFADVGSKAFWVGSDCQTDRVLVAPVTGGCAAATPAGV